MKRQKTGSDEAKQLLLDEAQAWSGTEGLIMVASDRSDGSWQHAPISLLPCSFPRQNFEASVGLCRPFNSLVDTLARDPRFLTTTLQETIKGDEFTRNLFKLYEKWGGQHAVQKMQLGIHRSDYMVDAETKRLLQVELNTISSSFGCLSARVTRLHRHLLIGNPLTRKACGELDNERFGAVKDIEKTSLPDNNAATAIPAAMAKAHGAYCSSRPKAANMQVVILFVVQQGESNYVDQRHLEYELAKSWGISVLRLTLAQVVDRACVSQDSVLVIDGEFEVSLVYFRAGYTPRDYLSQKEWDARDLLESSLSIKCPSIAYHLVGAKKVQQKLAEPGVLDQFVKSESDLTKLKACFAGLWSLGDDFDASVKKQALQNPSKFVVKPQREGGGNNLYGDDVRIALESMPPQELASHILMERIFPFTEKAFLIRNAELASGLSTCELGVFSVYLGDGETTLLDEPAGHLLRSKFDGVDEGGVASGFAALSSPLLHD